MSSGIVEESEVLVLALLEAPALSAPEILGPKKRPILIGIRILGSAWPLIVLTIRGSRNDMKVPV